MLNSFKILLIFFILFFFINNVSASYHIIILTDNNLNSNSNITIFKNDSYLKTIQYGDTIEINDSTNYTYVLYEDMKDKMGHIENINDISKNNISYIVYFLIFCMLLGLGYYFIKR